MGQRGPKPTPTKVLAMRGSWLAKTREGEPQPAAAVASPPAWLDNKSKALFRKKAAQMATVGTLTKHDVEALARYCRLWTRYREAEEFIMHHGSTIETYVTDREGNSVLAGLKMYPEVQVANTLAAELLRIENHFGFTPSARTNLRTNKKAPHADTDQKTRLFRQKA